jgi:hypothetical protein
MHYLILAHIDSNIPEFQRDLLIKLYNSTNENIKTNDIKAEKVNTAYTRFTSGIILFLLASVLGTVYIFVNPKKEIKEVTINNQLNLKGIEAKLDTSIYLMNKTLYYSKRHH